MFGLTGVEKELTVSRKGIGDRIKVGKSSVEFIFEEYLGNNNKENKEKIIRK